MVAGRGLALFRVSPGDNIDETMAPAHPGRGHDEKISISLICSGNITASPNQNGRRG